ncbi:MAG: ATP-grasp domain-containing protein [Sphingomonadales bacterium]|nr:ATP-grasp domain-containing protein [Sphingomonadales bacterium]
MLIAHDAAELQEFYSDRWFLKQPSMIQRYITGHGEGVFGLFRAGDPSVLFAHRRLRERPPSGGVSVLREAIALPEPMTDYAVRIMQFARWDGVAMIEFKVDRETQVPYLMEVNGRFWGSLQLAIDAGIDFPALLYNSVTGTSAPAELQPYRVGVRSHWWLGGVDHLLARLRNPAGELSLSRSAGSRGGALISLGNVFDNRVKNEIFRASDLAPGMNELAAYCRRLVTSIYTKLGNRTRGTYRKMRYALINFGLKAGLNRKTLGERFPQRARTVLVLCKGNICRSPFVDKYLRIAARQRALDLQVSSAGLDAKSGRQAHPLALERSFKVGVPLDEHRAQAVSETLVNEADIILVMEPDQQEELLSSFPQAAEKTFLLGHFDPERPVTEIADPYGRPAAEFDACYAQLSAACEGLLARLAPTS